MTIDIEQIKKALDHFENDEFVDSKEVLQKEIRKAKNDFLKNKLDLKNDVEPQDKIDQEADDEVSQRLFRERRPGRSDRRM